MIISIKLDTYDLMRADGREDKHGDMCTLKFVYLSSRRT
jgi:hypothetical protein